MYFSIHNIFFSGIRKSNSGWKSVWMSIKYTEAVARGVKIVRACIRTILFIDIVLSRYSEK